MATGISKKSIQTFVSQSVSSLSKTVEVNSLSTQQEMVKEERSSVFKLKCWSHQQTNFKSTKFLRLKHRSCNNNCHHRRLSHIAAMFQVSLRLWISHKITCSTHNAMLKVRELQWQQRKSVLSKLSWIVQTWSIWHNSNSLTNLKVIWVLTLMMFSTKKTSYISFLNCQMMLRMRWSSRKPTKGPLTSKISSWLPLSTHQICIAWRSTRETSTTLSIRRPTRSSL